MKNEKSEQLPLTSINNNQVIYIDNMCSLNKQKVRLFNTVFLNWDNLRQECQKKKREQISLPQTTNQLYTTHIYILGLGFYEFMQLREIYVFRMGIA
jgi:hypothetical protein